MIQPGDSPWDPSGMMRPLLLGNMGNKLSFKCSFLLICWPYCPSNFLLIHSILKHTARWKLFDTEKTLFPFQIPNWKRKQPILWCSGTYKKAPTSLEIGSTHFPGGPALCGGTLKGCGGGDRARSHVLCHHTQGWGTWSPSFQSLVNLQRN